MTCGVLKKPKNKKMGSNKPKGSRPPDEGGKLSKPKVKKTKKAKKGAKKK